VGKSLKNYLRFLQNFSANRMTAPPQMTYEFGPFRLDLTERLLLKKGKSVALTPKAFKVLALLIQRRGHLVEKGELMSEVWTDSFVEEANLSRTIWMLRQALNDDRNGQGIIQTVPKHGYRFIADVKEILARGASATRGTISSLAVLPLVNLSGNPSEEYLADGVTEGLIASLSRASELRVIAAKSVIAYKGTLRTPIEIARELDVDAILLGSFSLDHENVCINSKLLDKTAGETVWFGEFAGNWNGILYIQSDIAAAIAKHIDKEMPPPTNETRQINPEAYDLYLRARFRLLREKADEISEAISMLEDAVRIDRDFARAFAELARAYNILAYFFTPQEELLGEKAFIAMERASTLDPNLPEAHLARGLLLWTHATGFRHEQAITEYRRSLELNPNFDEARHQLGLVYHHIGLFEKAIAEYQLAIAINPARTLIHAHLAGCKNYEQKYEEALACLNGLPESIGQNLKHQKAFSLCHLGRFDEAVAVINSGLPDENGLLTAIMALIAAHRGNETEVEENVEVAIELGSNFGHFHHSAYAFGAAYAILKKPEPAIKWLQLAADDGFPCYPSFANDPDLDNIRNYPSFKDFMSKQKNQWELRVKSY